MELKQRRQLLHVPVGARLNRTSVELKPRQWILLKKSFHRLNRTSVELKHDIQDNSGRVQAVS